ncbi:riboflavin synthase [Candidatus Micrarchaeota archaeon]|nr:riboflavin synthase [Candidatus Micrarchaeota archaeon]MBU1681896.1 riboflavin synthase [Candidatus Micrarchaeota archaeon]
MKIGVIDTTFSRVNMGAIALDEMKKEYPSAEIERRTVPGIKDLGVECKKVLDGGCDICMALGMVGGAPIDRQCAHEASLGIQQAKLMTNKHIIEVFVHENEAWSGREFVDICQSRIRKHVHNTIQMILDPDKIMQNAGRGIRQGKNDEGPIESDIKTTIGIVCAEFNQEITDRMKNKALQTAKENGANVVLYRVPGVFDIPLVAKKLLMDKKIRGVVSLGAIVKGGTAHDEVIAKDTAKRLGTLSLEFNKPVTLGIIGHGVHWDDADERSEGYAERAVLSVLKIIKTIEE